MNILPGAGIVLAQLLGTMVIITFAKNFLMCHVSPKRTVFIYGKDIAQEEIEGFKERILKKYAHIFDVTCMLSEETAEEGLLRQLEECCTVLLYETSYGKRRVLAEYCLKNHKEIYFTPRLDDIILLGCQPKHLLDTPLFRYDYVSYKKAEYKLKRLFDIIFSFVLLIVVSPIMLLTALAIKLEDRGPVFYKQDRCTKDAKVFKIYKFTKVGKVIRMTRIDELPQIINILKGDMSFVGPRPERVEHVEKYTKELPEFAYRMRVKGGLTGYAQIYGKYNTSAYDKLRLDLMYIENQSFLLDLKILMLTFKIMFIPESTEGFSEEKSKRLSAAKQKSVKVGSVPVSKEI